MLNPEIISLLVCPETHQPLRLMEEGELIQLQEKFKQSQLNNINQQPISEEFDAALVREDGLVAYPVRNNIPVLLIEEAISLATS